MVKALGGKPKRADQHQQNGGSIASHSDELKSKSQFGRLLLALVGCAMFAVAGMEFQKLSVMQTVGGNNMMTTTSVRRNIETTKSQKYYPRLEFNMDQPIFSFSLPNTGMAILPRYFECAGHYDTFGRYWTAFSPKDKNRQPIGKCIETNMKRRKPALENCGDFDVWHDLQFRAPPNRLLRETKPHCFDPVLFQGSLDYLYQHKPNATIINMIRDPHEWYLTLSFDQHTQWNEWCNPTHHNAFPTENTEVAYLRFYEQYHQKLRDFVSTHSGWTLVEIDLASTSNEDIGNRLQQQLGIESKCWTRSVTGNIPSFSTNPSEIGAMTELLPRPNEITYPILTVSLPKSGTSTNHDYFSCNLGRFMSTHQWTVPPDQPQGPGLAIGECYETNTKKKLPPLWNCGHARVYSDIGIWNSGKRQCYYAQLMEGGLRAFVEHYPYGTIMLAVRNATEWISSATRWNNLSGRWAQTSGGMCRGVFPKPGSSTQVWEQFYHNNTATIRNFVKQHPTLTYIEVPLTDDTGPIMNNIFGFHKACWGHKNENTRNPVKDGNATTTTAKPKPRAKPLAAVKPKPVAATKPKPAPAAIPPIKPKPDTTTTTNRAAAVPPIQSIKPKPALPATATGLPNKPVVAATTTPANNNRRRRYFF